MSAIKIAEKTFSTALFDSKPKSSFTINYLSSSCNSGTRILLRSYTYPRVTDAHDEVPLKQDLSSEEVVVFRRQTSEASCLKAIGLVVKQPGRIHAFSFAIKIKTLFHLPDFRVFVTSKTCFTFTLNNM